MSMIPKSEYDLRVNRSKIDSINDLNISNFYPGSDEEKINVLEAEWSVSDVVSRWYHVGMVPDDEESDHDDDPVCKFWEYHFKRQKFS